MNTCIMNRFRCFGFSTQITIKLTHPYSMCKPNDEHQKNIPNGVSNSKRRAFDYDFFSRVYGGRNVNVRNEKNVWKTFFLPVKTRRNSLSHVHQAVHTQTCIHSHTYALSQRALNLNIFAAVIVNGAHCGSIGFNVNERKIRQKLWNEWKKQKIPSTWICR